jgi:hypothetical protein
MRLGLVRPENIERQGDRGMAILSLLQSLGLDRCSVVCGRATSATLSDQRTRVSS